MAASQLHFSGLVLQLLSTNDGTLFKGQNATVLLSRNNFWLSQKPSHVRYRKQLSIEIRERLGRIGSPVKCTDAGDKDGDQATSSQVNEAGEHSKEALRSTKSPLNSAKEASPQEPGFMGRVEQRAEPSSSHNNNPPEKKEDERPWWQKLPLQWPRPLVPSLVAILQGILFVVALRSVRFSPSTFSGANWNLPRSSHTVSTSVPYSAFLREAKVNNVRKVQVDGQRLIFSLKVARGSEKVKPSFPFMPLPEKSAKSEDEEPKADSSFYTLRPGDIETPYKLLSRNGVEFGALDGHSFKLLNAISVGLLYAGLVVALLGRLPIKFPQRSAGRIRGRKDSNGRTSMPVLFADVAGVDEAKEELEEIVEYLRDPKRFIQLGARPPRGVLLVGPPGTGKTLLARAVAGEADVPFVSCAASEFVELYVGLGAARVRELFAKAKKDAPSIVFIDEIDAVAKARDGRLRGMGNDEREQTLNQLLTELDGFETHETVIVMAATNRADVLDPALRRAGRFDRIVAVEPPDRLGRESILGVHIARSCVPIGSEVDLSAIAAATAGLTGADLANLVNEAALLAARKRRLVVGKEDFEAAVERSRGGIEKKRSVLGPTEKGVVARHEVGHAVMGTAVAMLLPGLPRVEKLSIVPRTGGALGFTYMPPTGEDRMLLFVDEVKGRLVTLLGGRAAEEVSFGGRVSTGALDDIRRATDVAYKAIAEYGLSSAVGPLSLETLAGGGFDESGGAAGSWGKDQGRITELVQKEVSELLRTALQVARCVVQQNGEVLEGLGAVLEGDEKVQGALLDQWLSKVQVPDELAEFIRSDELAPPVSFGLELKPFGDSLKSQSAFDENSSN